MSVLFFLGGERLEGVKNKTPGGAQEAYDASQYLPEGNEESIL